MSTRSLTQARPDPYAHVKGPLEGQTGQSMRNAKVPEPGKASRQVRPHELFDLVKASLVCRLLVECEEAEEEEHITAQSGSAAGGGPTIVDVHEEAARSTSAAQQKRTFAHPDRPFLLVDVREGVEDYDKLHVMEAVHCPRAAYLTQDRYPVELHLAKRMPGCTIICYDSGLSSGGYKEAGEVADKLAKTLPESIAIAVLVGGLAAVKEYEPFALDGTQAADVAAEAAAKAALPPTAAEMRAMQRQAAVVAAGLLKPSGASGRAGGRSGASDAGSVAASAAPGSPGSPGKASVRPSVAGSLRSTFTATTKAPGGAPGSIYKADAVKPPTFGTAARFRLPGIRE